MEEYNQKWFMDGILMEILEGEKARVWYSKVIVKGGKGSPMAGPWPEYWQSFGNRQSPLLPPLDVSPPTVVLSPCLGHLSEAHLYKLIFFQHLLEQDKQDQGKVKEVNVRPDWELWTWLWAYGQIIITRKVLTQTAKEKWRQKLQKASITKEFNFAFLMS